MDSIDHTTAPLEVPVIHDKNEAVSSSPPSFKSSSDVDQGCVLVRNEQGLQRRLGPRNIQLIAIGGSIGTALFITIGQALNKGGPASLFLAFAIYNVMVAMVNNSIAEISTYMPVSGGFIFLASKWVDDALGFMVGWNFFIYEALQIPFEITAINLILSYWRDDIPIAAVCMACIALYAILNLIMVKGYGESEFWLSSGKVLLIVILFMFTFVTMVGGNPQHDAYGFRNWNDPGAFAKYLHPERSQLAKFEGFLAALWAALYTCVGPEYISIVAAEAKHPRVYIKKAFITAYWRFGVFFVGSALCCGILVAYNDPILVSVSTGETEGGGSAASPYVMAMSNMGINVLPHIVNALLVTTVFSAGNTYTYCATRSLYGLSCDGKAPRILRKCTKQGVPIYCVAVVMLFPFLSFLQMSSSSSQVLTWLMDLTTASAIIDYIVMCGTFIAFYRAASVQGFDRSKLSYHGWMQPWCAGVGLVWMTIMVLCYGYDSFTPWNAVTFFTHYSMHIFCFLAFAGWKLIKQTRFLQPHELDLTCGGSAQLITAYEEAAYLDDPPVGFWRDVVQYFRISPKKRGHSAA